MWASHNDFVSFVWSINLAATPLLDSKKERKNLFIFSIFSSF